MEQKLQIQSIANSENTSYVVISREEERFVIEIHDHKQELRSSNEMLANIKNQEEVKNEKYSEATKKLGRLQARRKLLQAHPYSKHDHSRDGGDLAKSVSKIVTTML